MTTSTSDERPPPEMIQREGPASQPAQDTQTEVLRAYPDSPHVASPGFDHDELERVLSRIGHIAESPLPRKFRRAFDCALWVFGAIKWRRAQPLKNGFWYIELCPRYLLEVPAGVTEWCARKAWKRLHGAVGWWSVPAKTAYDLGAKLRELGENERWGRHLMLTAEALEALRIAAEEYVSPSFEIPAAYTEADFTLSVELKRLPSYPTVSSSRGKGASIAARCPCGRHAHGDQNPSLVLWRNLDETGGAICMTTRQTYFVEYDGNKARLAESMVFRKKKNLNKGNPRGRRVVDGPTAGPYLGARLDAWVGRSRPGRLSGDPLQALSWSDQVSRGPAATTRAADLGFISEGLPAEELSRLDATGIVSVSEMRPCEWASLRCRGESIRVPVRWEPCGQEWLLFDLDDLIPDVPLDALQRLVCGLARGSQRLSGRSACVRTSPEGCHVWLELERRWHPRRLFDSASWRRWYERVGEQMLEALGGVGELDWSSFAPGRWARRPGWRLLSDGTPWRIRLEWADGGQEAERIAA